MQMCRISCNLGTCDHPPEPTLGLRRIFCSCVRPMRQAFATPWQRATQNPQLYCAAVASKRPRPRRTSLTMKGSKPSLARIMSENSYRAVLLDQFGVLHDGSTPYPPSFAALSALQQSNVEIIVLSNSSRRANHASSKLASMFPDVPPLEVMTSGELARELFHSFDPVRNPIAGARAVIHVNWTGRGSISARDNNLPPLTADVSEADAMVIHGTEGISASGCDGKEVVEDVASKDLEELVVSFAKSRPNAPFVIVNPDVVTVDGTSLRDMPGKLGIVYEAAGGRGALRVGKPGAPAYEEALARLAAKGIRKEEVVAIGDSVAHDVQGAQQAGIDCIYIAGGIDASKFGLDLSVDFGLGSDLEKKTFEMDWRAWDAVVAEAAPDCNRPAHVLDYFRW